VKFADDSSRIYREGDIFSSFACLAIRIMYIKEIKLTNIRSIRELHMTFDKPAGWHVILGDNGAGKTSILRAICAGLVGPTEILRLNPSFGTWVTVEKQTATISLKIEQSVDIDKRAARSQTFENTNDFWCKTVVKQDTENGRSWKFLADNASAKIDPNDCNWSDNHKNGWFSAAFGPYRRFIGGDDNWKYIFKQNPKIGAYLTAFNEGVALTESVRWLIDALLDSHLNLNSKNADLVENVKTLLNSGDLLPRGYSLMDVNSDGLFFSTPTGDCIHLYELSEGLKSVTSLTLELLRLLVDVYGYEKVFSNFQNEHTISSVGVVLIDEIDVHLHPSWQARIGQWFTTVFPKIQFIVTTHSPIICRAGVDGSIWHLALTEENEVQLKQIKGQDLNDLVFGDVLDAYSTDYFGTNITRSEEGQKEVQLLAKLNQKHLRKQITAAELEQRAALLKKYPLV
jgi:predicted ATP-binding protein involved in virulence